MPKFFALGRKKKLRATTARKPLRIAATADYDEMTEPNMKLSRALLIVLVLHVVAVSGIIAFNAIKTRQGPVTSPLADPSPAKNLSVNTTKTESAPANLTTTPKESGRHEDNKSSHAAAKSSGKEEHLRAIPVSSSDSGKVYVVAKGDNPVSIAKKFKVSYDDLLALNRITDPHKLQIGQKLLLPKSIKPKKTDE